MSNILIGLKMTCLGVLEIGDREKGSEIGLKEGGRIKIETTVRAPLRDARSLRLNSYRSFSFLSCLLDIPSNAFSSAKSARFNLASNMFCS